MRSSPRDSPAEARRLMASARAVIGRAYAPYSGFRVAAAVLDDRGRIFTGVNVENASFGLTVCAERVAIVGAIAAGARAIVAVAVIGEGVHDIAPCGACRQVMSEFCAGVVPVYTDAGADGLRSVTVAELLPKAFGAASLRASKRGGRAKKIAAPR